jgi:hypothetical protein
VAVAQLLIMEGPIVNHETTPPPLRAPMRTAAGLLGGRVVELHVTEPHPLPAQQPPAPAPKTTWAELLQRLQQMEAMAVVVLDEAHELDDSSARKSFVRRVKRVRRTVNSLAATAAHGGEPPPDPRQLILPHTFGGDGRTAMTPDANVSRARHQRAVRILGPRATWG